MLFSRAAVSRAAKHPALCPAGLLPAGSVPAGSVPAVLPQTVLPQTVTLQRVLLQLVLARAELGRPERHGPEAIPSGAYPAHRGAQPRVGYPAVSARAERLLCVKQAVSRPRSLRDEPSMMRREQPRKVGRRRLRRRLAQATARIEKSPEYQRSLAELAQLAAGFQAELEPAQKGQWLALEEALLEHVAWLNRSYFHAGAAWGERSGRPQQASFPALERDPRRRARSDADVMVALARAVMKLARR